MKLIVPIPRIESSSPPLEIGVNSISRKGTSLDGKNAVMCEREDVRLRNGEGREKSEALER